MAVVSSPAFGQAAPATLPQRATILTGSTAHSLFEQCSRASPQAVSFWTPTASDVRAAEQSLPAFLRTAKPSVPYRPLSKRRLDLDYRQYAGFVAKNGHNCLYVNAFVPVTKDAMEEYASSPGKRFNWRRDPVDVCDGGDSFWGAEYDTQTKKWSHLYFNGVA